MNYKLLLTIRSFTMFRDSTSSKKSNSKSPLRSKKSSVVDPTKKGAQGAPTASEGKSEKVSHEAAADQEAAS